MSEDKIYPTMVIRSQAEAIELLEKENKQLKSILTELEEYWENQQEHYRYYKDNRYRTFLSKNLNKIQELKEKYK